MKVLPTAYLAPISYYATLFHEPEVVIEAHEHYVKQTLRNRCVIGTGQGPQTLSINVEKGNKLKMPITEIRLSSHGNWMHQHLYSLATYYGSSPFFEYYIDELKEVMLHGHDGTLFGLNEALRCKICELLGFAPHVRYSEEWMGVTRLGEELVAPGIVTPRYYQVAGFGAEKQPFMHNLSILDLLFNMGNESVLVLRQMEPRLPAEAEHLINY